MRAVLTANRIYDAVLRRKFSIAGKYLLPIVAPPVRMCALVQPFSEPIHTLSHRHKEFSMSSAPSRTLPGLAITTCAAFLAVGLHLNFAVRSATAADTAAASSGSSAEPNTLSDAEKAAGWKLLFDGKTTDGWRNYKKQDVSSGWQVK